VGKGDIVVECANLLSFKNSSFITCLGKACCCYTTWHFWLVGDTCFSRIIVLGEGILDKRNHFLNIMSKMGHE